MCRRGRQCNALTGERKKGDKPFEKSNGAPQFYEAVAPVKGRDKRTTCALDRLGAKRSTTAATAARPALTRYSGALASAGFYVDSRSVRSPPLNTTRSQRLALSAGGFFAGLVLCRRFNRPARGRQRATALSRSGNKLPSLNNIKGMRARSGRAPALRAY